MTRPPKHFAIVNHFDPAFDKQIAFWAEGVRLAMVEHVHPHWRDWADPPGVAFYSYNDHPPSKAAVITFVADGFNDDAQAYHAAVGSLVFGIVDMSRAKNPSLALSHEVLEAWRNPFLKEWTPDLVTTGRDLAVEIADFDQRTHYDIDVNLMGETRKVQVANFATPNWFGMPSNGRQFDFLGRCRYMRENMAGGYFIAHANGETVIVNGAGGGAFGASKFSPFSRTSQVIRRGRA